MSESMARIVRPPLVHRRVLPESARGFERVDTGGLPPCALVAGAMDCPVMGAAQRYSEFVAGLTAERPRLGVSKMMWVRWFAAADEACLLSDVTQMVPVAVPARCSNREDAFVDAGGLITSRTGHLRLVLRPRPYRCGTLAGGSFVYST